MCGIAGISSADQDEGALQAALTRMVAALRHRGPDDQGSQLIRANSPKQTVLLANTRLAIMDLTKAGHQPMHDPLTGNWIAYNGEVYNHLELRKELGPEPWQSHSDTETILRAYRTWGAECVRRFEGMFAFALWDAREQMLWCARDRMGIKPFYFYRKDNLLVFASELRALLASGLVPRTIDSRGLAGYARFGSLPEPSSLIQDALSLDAGNWMKVRSGRIERQHTYWSAPPENQGGKLAENLQSLRRRLEHSVSAHLLSDVPVACFLSGGIDSSIVTALAAGAAEGLHTFTVGFKDADIDESAFAQTVAEKYHTRHHRVLLSDDEAAAQIPQAVEAMDLPTIDGLNTYVVSRAVAQAGLKVVLSGLGGDELFGGYPSFWQVPWAERWSPLIGQIPKQLRARAAGGSSRGGRAAELTDARVSLQERYHAVRSLWSKPDLEEAGLLDSNVKLGDDASSLESALSVRVSRLELTGYMRSVLLRDSDAMSMAHGLELRVPFLDHLFVELCLNSHASASAGKRKLKPVLLRAFGDLLPEGLAGRPKQGFVLPMEKWMRGPLAGFVDDGLGALGKSALVPRVKLSLLKERFLGGALQWARLWQFVVLGHWARRHSVSA